RLTELGPGEKPVAPPAATGGAGERRWTYVLAAVAVVALVAGVTLFRPHMRRIVVESSRLIVSTTPIERHPAISPDGLTIAYAGGTDVNSRQIYLRALAGGDPVQLTSDAGDHISPAWSPDGGRIAFVVAVEGQPCRILIKPARGGDAREVGRCRTDDRTQVAWTHAGDGLYFIDRPSVEAPDRVMRLDLASGRR